MPPLILWPRAFLVVSLFSSLQTMSALASSGIVGYGIRLFPDLCCQACYDSLSSLHLSCTDFAGSSSMSPADMMGMAMGTMDIPMATTSDGCYASNAPWLQTMAYCIQRNCDAAGYSADKQAECFSQRAVAGASQPAFDASLPPTPPTVELAGDATWLNSTSLVNAALYRSIYGTYQEFERQERLHSTYSLAVVLAVLGVCVMYGTWAQIGSTFPALLQPFQKSSILVWAQQHLILPAILGTRRLEPLPGQVGYAPRRILGISILSYVILNVVLSSVSFRSFQPNTYFFSAGFELCEYVGNRTGVLSLANLSMAILFAGRNNPLIAWTGWSQTTFLTLHRWAARIAALQAIVHSIVYTVAYFEPGYDGAAAYAAKATEAFFQWGIIATIAMCMGLGFAILPFRTRFYEVFLAVHVAMAVLCLVGCWYHIVPHFGYDYGYQVWLYISFAFWATDRLARVARVAFFNRLARPKAVVESIPGANVMQLTLFPRTIGNCGPGKHTFLYFLGLGKPWESHPFTIAAWSPLKHGSTHTSSHVASVDTPPAKEPGPAIGEVSLDNQSLTVPSICILARPHAGVTAALQKQLLTSSLSMRTEVSVYSEGPYGGHRAKLKPLLTADTVLCLVGGIGITSALGFLQSYTESKVSGDRLMMKTTRFILAWSAREAPLIQHVRNNHFVDFGDVEYRIWFTGSTDGSESTATASEGMTAAKYETVNSERMNISTVLRDTLEIGVHTVVMCCGPGGMVDEVAKHVAQYSGQGFHVDLLEELYAW